MAFFILKRNILKRKWHALIIILIVLSVIIIIQITHKPAVDSHGEKNLWWANFVNTPMKAEKKELVEQKTEIPRKLLKIFHLDLKGAPPKMKYLLNVLPVIRHAGANGILIEYEDMFPFVDELRNVSAVNCYTRSEVRSLVTLAESLGMVVIPLIQTFGHLEFVLKLEEFQHLRELDSFPQEVCPSKTESLQLIKAMIKQVIHLHPNSKFVHIGCDEVFHLGVCPFCSRTNPRTIFMRHVTKIANFVKYTFPGVSPLMWDDMLRRWPASDLEESDLGSLVEPVIWVYIQDIYHLVPHYIWNMYKKTFPKLWAASAFKGATGETEIVPNISRHYDNNLAWLKLMKNQHEANILKPDMFAGIFLTGWSRYDHFAVLSELLPVGIPSLLLNLILVDQYWKRAFNDEMEVFTTWHKTLQCPSGLPIMDSLSIKDNRLQWLLGTCSFPGNNLYAALEEYQMLRARLEAVTVTVSQSGWASEYNVNHNYTNPWRVLELMPQEGFAAQFLKKDLMRFKSNISVIMLQYFDRFTVDEWIEQKIAPMELKLRKIETDFGKLIRQKKWPRRPLVHRNPG